MLWSKIIPINADKVTQFACDELMALSKSQGIHLQKADVAKGWDKSIVLSTISDAPAEFNINVVSNSEDAFLIKEQDSTLILAGNSSRAVLFAVYQFCRDFLGLEWVYPGDSFQMERQIKTLSFSAIYEPMIKRRGFVFETIKEPEYIKAMIDWLAKNRVQEVFFTFFLWDQLKEVIEPEVEKRGLKLTLGGHSMMYLLNKTGNKAFSAKKAQIDYNDVSWQSSLFNLIIQYCRNTPSLSRISLWPEDIGLSQESADNPFLHTYISFTERLKAVLKKEGLKVEVEHIAYNAGLSWEMLELRSSTEVSHSVDTLFAYWGRDYRKGLDSSPVASDQRAHQALRLWREKVRENNRGITIFEYYSDHFMLTHLFPSIGRRIQEDMAYYHETGVDGILNLVVPFVAKDDISENREYPWRWVHGFNSYCFARLSWGDSLSDVLNDYFAIYGNNQNQVKEWFEAIEKVIPAITSFNVPLFPARAVDCEKTNSNQETEKLVTFFKDVQGKLHSFIEEIKQKESNNHYEMAAAYLKWLYEMAGLYENKWVQKL